MVLFEIDPQFIVYSNTMEDLRLTEKKDKIKQFMQLT